jgi:Glutaredoxin-like domain protein
MSSEDEWVEGSHVHEDDELMESLEDKEFRNALRDALKDMRDKIDIYVFIDSKDANCIYCKPTEKLMKIIEIESSKAGSPLARVHVFDKTKTKDQEFFKSFNVERVPTVAFLQGQIRWTGSPIGQELRALVETIIRLSSNDSMVDSNLANKLYEGLKGEVVIETVVTPTCPVCPYAALEANMFAFEMYKRGKANILSNIIEAQENPDIADKYSVMYVPTVAINGVVEFVGVPPEEGLVEAILKHQKA